MRRAVFSLNNATTGQLAGTDSIVRGSGCLTWHSTYESTGSATAQYNLMDGPTRSGIVLAYVSLSAAQSTRDSIPFHCVPFVDSLHINVVSGSINGSLVAWVDHVCEKVLDHEARLRELQAVTDLAALGG